MKKKLFLSLVTVALAVANAASSYNLTLSSPVWAGSSELKPGVYKVTLESDKVVFTKGKTVVEAPATTGNAEKKYSGTSYVSVDSKMKELYLGGTTTKVIFGGTAPAAAGTK
jgi:hypothetical protein